MEIIGFFVCIYLLYLAPKDILETFAFIVTMVTLMMWLAEVAGTLIGELLKKIWRKKDD